MTASLGRVERSATKTVSDTENVADLTGVHSERNAAWLGICLGVAFGICFLTGLLSHLIQHPPGWFTWPARPAGLYRVTQGLHVATGIAAIPLLLVKLWTVSPSWIHSGDRDTRTYVIPTRCLSTPSEEPFLCEGALGSSLPRPAERSCGPGNRWWSGRRSGSSAIFGCPCALRANASCGRSWAAR
jgi:hypothetical protein